MKHSRRTLLQYVAAHRSGATIGQKGRRAPRERPFFGLCFTSQSDVIKAGKGGHALASSAPHTKERLRHIGSFLKAHSKDATTTPNWGNEENPSPAWIGWLMHGGEAGQKWVNDKVGKVDMTAARQQAAGPRHTSQELADLEYRAVLSRSDPRILVERGGRIPSNPLAPKELAVPGSEAEYDMPLDKSDPRINMRKRR